MRADLKWIRMAFDALHCAFDHQHINYADRLLDRCVEEEQDHRGWGPDFNKYHPGAIGVKDCARLFAVKRVAQYLRGDNLPEVKDYLHMQKSCFMAAAMALNNDADIRKEWKRIEVDIQWLAELDYTDFVKAVTPKVEVLS